jgi:hypothetical protein
MIRDHLIPQERIVEEIRPKMLMNPWIIQVRMFCLERLGIRNERIPWQTLFSALHRQLSWIN